MAKPARNRRETDGLPFKQQDPSAWISFDPELTGHRKDVRSAAAKSSAAARKATIARKLALKTDCSTADAQDSGGRSKKRRREHEDTSPLSTSSSTTLNSRRPSEISLFSIGSGHSQTSSSTGSPCLVNAPQLSQPTLSDQEASKLFHMSPTFSEAQPAQLQRAVAYVLGVDETLVRNAGCKEPTSFGALRIKSRTTSNVHDAIAERRSGSATLLAVALLAAWDLKTCDERWSLLHLRAWHQLALPQNVVPRCDGLPPANVTVVEAIWLSLQWHLPPDVFQGMSHLFQGTPTPPYPPRNATGSEIVVFFDILGDLTDRPGIR